MPETTWTKIIYTSIYSYISNIQIYSLTNWTNDCFFLYIIHLHIKFVNSYFGFICYLKLWKRWFCNEFNWIGHECKFGNHDVFTVLINPHLEGGHTMYCARAVNSPIEIGPKVLLSNEWPAQYNQTHKFITFTIHNSQLDEI